MHRDENVNKTVDDIRATFPKKKNEIERSNLFGHFLFRKISFYIAWLLIRLGISANTVTYFSIIIGLIGCMLLIFGNFWDMILGALILNIWVLLEYVDGNVARATNSGSRYGAFIDDLNAFLMSVLIYICAGISVYYNYDYIFRSLDRSIFPFLGCLASLGYIFPRFIGLLFQKAFSEGDVLMKEDVLGNSLSFFNIISSNLYNITGIIMPILITAVVLKSLDVFIIVFTMTNTLVLIISIALLFMRARNIERLT